MSAPSAGGWCVLSPPRPSHWVSWVHSWYTISYVPCVSFWELISGCGPPGGYPGPQEDLISKWEPAHSWLEDAVSGAEIAPHLLTLAVAHLPLCLQQGVNQCTAS